MRKAGTDARLRVIFDNGTESDLLMRSLQRALHKDEAGRRITDPSAGPLFSDQHLDDNSASGTIYVLRSKSDHPMVAQNRDIVHKIGVTSGRVDRRTANAKLDATFMLADVEVVATYQLFNINRSKLENLIHRIFDPARLNIEIKDHSDIRLLRHGGNLRRVPLHVGVVEQREWGRFARTVASGTVLIDNGRDIAIKRGSGCRRIRSSAIQTDQQKNRKQFFTRRSWQRARKRCTAWRTLLPISRRSFSTTPRARRNSAGVMP